VDTNLRGPRPGAPADIVMSVDGKIIKDLPLIDRRYCIDLNIFQKTQIKVVYSEEKRIPNL
jgi:hypothetical protein